MNRIDQVLGEENPDVSILEECMEQFIAKEQTLNEIDWTAENETPMDSLKKL